MSGAFLIAIEDRSFEPDIEYFGRDLARQARTLERLAKKLSVRPLTSFVSIDEGAQEDMRELIEETGGDISDWRTEPVKWFSPDEGLETVRAILNQLRNNSNEIRNGSGLIDELVDLERFLVTMRKRNTRWRFWIDT